MLRSVGHVRSTPKAVAAVWRRPAVAAFLVVLLAASAVSFFLWQQIQAHAAFPYDLDEANHANGALALLLGLQSDGPAGLVSAFLQQGFYPPAFSVFRLLTFATLGVSVTAARLASVLAFFAAVLLIYALSLRLDRRRGWLAGLLACGATLTVGPLLVNAALVMKEAPGLLLSMLFLWLYVRTLTRATPRRLAVAGVALLLVFLTKYTYGLATLGTAVLLELSLLFWPPEDGLAGTTFFSRLHALSRRRFLWLFGPYAAGLAVWFAFPGNVGLFLDYLTAQPPGAYTPQPDSMFFYLRSIVRSQAPAPVFALLTALSLLWALWRWRNVGLRLLLIYFAAGLALVTFIKTQNPRFIVTFVPALHILSGLMVAWLADRLADDDLPRRARQGALAALAAVVVIVVLSVPNIVRRYRQLPAGLTVAYETDPQLDELAAWIQSQIPPGQRFYVINYWDQFGPQTLAWRLGTQALRANSEVQFSDVLMPSALLQPASPQRAAQLRAKLEAGDVSHILVLEGGPWGAPFWPDYSAALQDGLQQTGETTMTIPHPVARGEWQTLDIKAIVYRWSGDP